jgi:hypothetical protein
MHAIRFATSWEKLTKYWKSTGSNNTSRVSKPGK